MTRCRSPLTVLLVLPLLLLSAPVHAQETDTTAVDTAQTAPTDTAAVDTPKADTSATDTPDVDAAQVPATPDTLTTDTTMTGTDSTAMADTVAADTMAADTTLSPAARRERAKEQAQTTAEAWLALTDAGQFGASWDEAAASLQRSVSREAWQKRGARARAPLDSLKNRELTRAVYRDSTSQIPGGAPVVALQYSTEFEGEWTLEAVITAKQGADWKVAGYRVVKPRADSARVPDTTQTPPEPDSMQVQPAPDTTQNTSEPDSTQGQ